MKTSELSGAALDWAVAKCEGFEAFTDGISWIIDHAGSYQPLPKYSTNWAQGGPIIEREEIELRVIPTGRNPDNWQGANDFDAWEANVCPPDVDYVRAFGPTPLIAAMRCFVESKLGDEIELPEELK